MRRSPIAIAALVFAASLVYAIVRYNVFADVSIAHLPLFIVNKALSMGGLVVLGLSRLAAGDLRRGLGAVSCLMLVAHAIASVLLLRPEYFDRFFDDDGKLTGAVELSMLAGIVGLAIMIALSQMTRAPATPPPASPSLLRGAGRTVLLLGALHVAMIGWDGWFEPSTWPGWLPPITLVSFAAAIALVVARRRRPSGV